jgi:hypothetical protein
MATHGNLELRIGENTLYASCTHEGDEAYGIASKLVDFLDQTKTPTVIQYQEWFKKISEILLPYNHYEGLIGGVPTEVIIDVPRRLLLHTPADELPASFQKACSVLKNKYEYQVLEYVKPLMRNTLYNR